jgi:hypothetical protein
MAIILPQRWTRQPQNRVALDPKWVAAGLNLALIPQGNGLVDCSNKNRQGSGGVRSQTTAPQGRMVSRTSGAYVFRGLSQSTVRFSLIALVRVTNIANENVISISATSTTDFVVQFTIFQSQINLICGNTAIVAASTNSGLANNRTYVVGLTHDGSGAGSTIFYIDGKQLNTVSGTQTFMADGTGTMFVKHDGSTNPLVGSLGLHLDFATVLKPEHMIALTGNPWQVFAPQRPLYADVQSGAVSHSATGALIGGGAVIVGSAAHIAKHAATGVLAGGGAVIVGSASSKTTRAATGVLVGQGAVVAGTAARIRIHPSSGTLTGQGAVIVGSAARTRVHPATGVLQGAGAVITGDADRSGSASTHDASGELIGGGSAVSGTATIVTATEPVSYGGWAGGNIIRKKPQQEPEQVSEQVQEIVAEVAKAVLIDTEPEQRQALKDALEAQEIAFKQAYFDALKKQLIKEYMLAAEYRRIAIKQEEETIVFMMMALA